MTHFYPDDAAIARLGEAFLARTLPKAEWSHAAHFATTLWLLRHRPDIVPEHDMPRLIRAYNESVGGVNDDHEGYHETITLASIGAARAFRMARPDGEPLHLSVDALMDGPLGRSDWPLVYWSRERLFSVAARQAWCDPDLAPFIP